MEILTGSKVRIINTRYYPNITGIFMGIHNGKLRIRIDGLPNVKILFEPEEVEAYTH